MLYVYGRGDHGGWPTEKELRLIENLNEDPSFPARFEFTSTEKYFELIKEERSDIPVLKDEMNFTFEGAYTTHADMKQINRQSENLLLTAEACCSIANMFMERPHGAKERPANGHEVPAITWFDLSHDNAGLSLLNNAKYGCSIDGATLALSLLRNPSSPQCPDPNPDEGWHLFALQLLHLVE